MTETTRDDLEAIVADLRARVQALEDDRAIRNLLARYGYMMDSENFDGFVDLYTDDAAIDLTLSRVEGGDLSGASSSSGTGRAVWSGKAGLRKFTTMPGPDHLRMHLQGNNVVVNIDGDEAVANAYQVSLTTKNGATSIVAASNNRWQFQKVDGKWLIKERRAAYLGDDYYAGNIDATIQ